MHKVHTLSIENATNPADETIISQHLAAFNTLRAGANNHQPLNIFLRDEQNQLIGGLLGGTYWGWLFIEILWITEEARGCGYGQKMVQMAEQEAIKRGCKHAHLDTMSFQAPDFYIKLGYSIFGKLEDMPTGHTRYYLQKSLNGA